MGEQAPVGVEVDAGERTGPERQPVGLRRGEREALAVAVEHPEVREQVVGEVDRLGALEVSVAGQRPVEVLLGARQQHARSPPPRASAGDVRLRTHVHRHVGRDLVVARARRVQRAADRPDELGQAPLDRHVDVFVAVREGERPARELGLDRVEAREQGVAVLARR